MENNTQSELKLVPKTEQQLTDYINELNDTHRVRRMEDRDGRVVFCADVANIDDCDLGLLS